MGLFVVSGKDGAWAQARKNIEWLHPSRVRDGNGIRPGEPGYDKRTVTVPKHVMEAKSKSQRQYWETKCKYMDTVLFFKVVSSATLNDRAGSSLNDRLLLRILVTFI